jgi:hypothetical protein
MPVVSIIMPKVWEILSQFKDCCKVKGWRTSVSEDWVEVDGSYHNFLWARDVHPSSFKRIALSRKCVVREGLSYRVVETSCCAWLLSQPPSETLVKTILENPDFSNRIAIYDFSLMSEGKNLCIKLNLTDNPIFKEFENFLKSKLKIKIEPISSVSVAGTNPDSCTVTELA